MKGYLTVFSAFLIMLCLGSVYGWSIIANELRRCCELSGFQSQLVFALMIGLFPLTMVFVGQLGGIRFYRFVAGLSAVLFATGYLIASVSGGKFLWMALGIGVLGGVATGLGYWVSVTIPVMWFPERKGLITGVVTAAFGLGAFFISIFAPKVLVVTDIFGLFRLKALFYGAIIFISSQLIWLKAGIEVSPLRWRYVRMFSRTSAFRRALAGIFCGTFAGLVIVGSLAMIGEQKQVAKHLVAISVGLFSVANFTGRVIWGWLSDRLGTEKTIVMALFLQAAGIFLLTIINNDLMFLIFTFTAGVGFGGNFVLFARYTAQQFGLEKFSTIYPYIFLGYALAGLVGPSVGGMMFDVSGTYLLSGFMAIFMSILGLIFFVRK